MPKWPPFRLQLCNQYYNRTNAHSNLSYHHIDEPSSSLALSVLAYCKLKLGGSNTLICSFCFARKLCVFTSKNTHKSSNIPSRATILLLPYLFPPSTCPSPLQTHNSQLSTCIQHGHRRQRQCQQQYS